MNPLLTEREREIIDILAGDSSTSVNELSRRLSVSTVTVRSDLNNLSEKGIVMRVRGGALPAFHPEVLRRQRLHHEAKQRIARAAADLIGDGDTVMIEAGTTTSLVGQYLLGKRDVKIVSNSSLIIPFVRMNPSIRLTIAGGEFHPDTESFVGPLALDALDRFHVRLAIIGTDGFTAAHGLTTHILEGAEVVRKMAGRAARTVLVADSSKYGQKGFVQVLPVERIQTVITDSGLPVEARAELQAAGIEVIIV